MTTKVLTKTATMDTRKLYEALQKVDYIKQRRDLPIYSNAYVEFTNGKVILTTTDLERVIRVEIDSTNSEIFSILLPRKLTARFLSGANGKVSITQGKLDKQLVLSRDGIGNFNLTVPQVSDFPQVHPMPDNLQWHTLEGKWLCSMLRIIATACEIEGARPILNGIACNDGAMAATDGFRLHFLKDSRLTFGLGDRQAIIPLDTINLIVRLFRNEKTLEVAFETAKETSLGAERETAKYVYFKSNDVLIMSQIIQGTYPQYMQFVPNTFQCKVSFSSPLMVQRLNMIDPKALSSGIVRYDFKMLEHGEQVCSISAHAEGDYGENDYKLSCPVKLEANEGKIAFNYKYLLDAIKPFSLCNLELLSLSSPGKFTGDIEGLTIVVMPMFVQW